MPQHTVNIMRNYLFPDQTINFGQNSNLIISWTFIAYSTKDFLRRYMYMNSKWSFIWHALYVGTRVLGSSPQMGSSPPLDTHLLRCRRLYIDDHGPRFVTGHYPCYNGCFVAISLKKDLYGKFSRQNSRPVVCLL